MKIQFAVSGEQFELTTDRAESSYGIPVLVFRGVAYGWDDEVPAFGGVQAKSIAVHAGTAAFNQFAGIHSA